MFQDATEKGSTLLSFAVALREQTVAHRALPPSEPTKQMVVCTENSVLIDYVTESPNVTGDDHSVMLLPDPVGLAVRVEEPT